MKNLLQNIKNNLTPDLLKKEYVDQNKTNPMFGHCYVATEALYHLLQNKDYKPHRAKDKNNIVHWWLQNIKTKEILDPTADQYYSLGEKPPYGNGKCGGFLTKQPSKRAKKLIDRITSF